VRTAVHLGDILRATAVRKVKIHGLCSAVQIRPPRQMTADQRICSFGLIGDEPAIGDVPVNEFTGLRPANLLKQVGGDVGRYAYRSPGER
jgi:hypothetical protein